MADTIRTLQELNQLFADNTTADVSSQDIRDVFQSLLVHGVIGILDNTSTVSVGTSYGALTLFTQELHARWITTDLVNATLTTPAALTTAKYTLTVELNVEGVAADDFTFALFELPSTKINVMERMVPVPGSGPAHFYWSVPGVTLAGGTEIQLAAQAAAGPTDLRITNGMIAVQRLGIE